MVLHSGKRPRARESASRTHTSRSSFLTMVARVLGWLGWLAPGQGIGARVRFQPGPDPRCRPWCHRTIRGGRTGRSPDERFFRNRDICGKERSALLFRVAVRLNDGRARVGVVTKTRACHFLEKLLVSDFLREESGQRVEFSARSYRVAGWRGVTPTGPWLWERLPGR